MHALLLCCCLRHTIGLRSAARQIALLLPLPQAETIHLSLRASRRHKLLHQEASLTWPIWSICSLTSSTFRLKYSAPSCSDFCQSHSCFSAGTLKLPGAEPSSSIDPAGVEVKRCPCGLESQEAKQGRTPGTDVSYLSIVASPQLN